MFRIARKSVQKQCGVEQEKSLRALKVQRGLSANLRCLCYSKQPGGAFGFDTMDGEVATEE